MINYEYPFLPMNAKQLTPKVGLGVIIERNKKVLLGLRHGSHGSNQWGLIGGHLEVGEILFQCAQREVKEEIGIHIYGIQKVGFTNNIFWTEGLHYITLFVRAQWDVNQEPKIIEPEKCLELKWFDNDMLPDNVFGSVRAFFNGTLNIVE